MPAELWQLSADALAAGYLAGEFSPVEVLASVEERIDEVNSSVTAIVTRNPHAADEARAAERAFLRGDPAGELCGVPYTLKDLTATAGLRTTYGSERYRDHIPAVSSVVAQRMKSGGGVLIGKTNTPDHGCKAVTDNTIFGATRNPWDPSRTAGGSSGGAAAAVALGMGALAEGSDYAGSVRIPAAHCGVVGFKPSDGRVPVHPEPLPFFPMSFVHGPLSRTVIDAAMMLDVIAGTSDQDPRSIDREPGSGYAGIARRAGPDVRLRVAYLGGMGVTEVEPDVQRQIMHALGRLESLGAEVCDVRLDMSDMMDAYAQLNSARRAALLIDDPDELPHDLDPALLQRLTATQARSSLDFAQAMRAQGEAFERLQRVLRDYDFLVSPVTPTTAFPLGRNFPEAIGGIPLRHPLDLVGLTAMFNLTGHPAVSLPAGLTAEGLPVGLQIVGPYRRDSALIHVAAAFERTAPAPAWPPSPTFAGASTG